MTNAFCSDSNISDATPEPPRLVQAGGLLSQLWPDERSRPSLRWLREQQSAGNVPAVRVGRRVWFNVDAVRQQLRAALTVKPLSNRIIPLPDTLIDAEGALVFLEQSGVRRSLRWLRSQQESRTLPFIRWGRRVFFSPAQLRTVMLDMSGEFGSF